MANKFSHYLGVIKKVFYSKGFTVFWAILSVGLIGLLLWTNYANHKKAPQSDNAEISDTINTNVTPTTDNSNNDDTNEQKKNDANNAHDSSFNPPIDVSKKIHFPTATPTPTGNDDLVDVNLLKSVVVTNDIVSQNISNNGSEYVYGWYMGLGKDVDPSLPKNSHVFIGMDLDKNEDLVTHIYIFNNNAFSQKLDKVIYGLEYSVGDEIDTFKDKDFIFHIISKVKSYDKQAYENYVTGIYKGKASDIVDDSYRGYADLQAKWRGDTIHFLIPMVKTSYIKYNLGERYTFIVESYDNSVDPNVYKVDGDLVYLPDEK